MDPSDAALTDQSVPLQGDEDGAAANDDDDDPISGWAGSRDSVLHKYFDPPEVIAGAKDGKLAKYKYSCKILDPITGEKCGGSRVQDGSSTGGLLFRSLRVLIVCLQVRRMQWSVS